MQESLSQEILINEDENEELLRLLIKFLYTGSFDCTSEEKFVDFLLLSNKYLVKTVKDLKTKPKFVFDSILSNIKYKSRLY